MRLPEKLKTQDLYDIPTLLLIMKDKINEIIDYLEQYEQQKPCEHKNTEDIYGIKHCLDCHLVGNF